MLTPLCLALTLLSTRCAEAARGDNLLIERVSTVIPFPRGIEIIDGRMYVLSRGRVRDSGGVSAEVNDRAGTIFVIDPEIAEPAAEPEVSDAVRTNGAVFALPTEPPFRLWRRDSNPPESDRETDRPYCTLRFHAPTQSFYVCGFSGIDLKQQPGRPNFSKNVSDTILRYDLRTKSWHEVERHHLHAGGNYPHHDPQHNPPPHGWLNGPDNILAVGNNLYAATKDNSLLVRYDLAALARDPNAGHPQSEVIFNENVFIEGEGVKQFYGQSALAQRDGWLYVGYRTSSVIVRLPIDAERAPKPADQGPACRALRSLRATDGRVGQHHRHVLRLEGAAVCRQRQRRHRAPLHAGPATCL